MMTAYDRFRRGERSALAPLVQAMRSGRYPSLLAFANLALELEGGRTDAARAEILEYERSLLAEGIDPASGRAAADDSYERFMVTLKSFTFD